MQNEVCEIDISPKNKENLIIANSLDREGRVKVAGLVGAAVFESVIEDLEEKLTGENLKEGYGARIDNLVDEDEKIIDNKVEIGLKRAWEERNHIMHPTSKNLPFWCSDYDSCCKSLVDTLIRVFSINVHVDYEEKAKVEESLFPDAWLKTGGALPKKLLSRHFSDLVFAAGDYMAPLGGYLQANCLASLDPSLRFQRLSRVNYTSGYLWLSAVRSNIKTIDYRARVALPGLTIVLKPTGINVYVELPGMAVEYKKIYYEKLLQYSNLTEMLKNSPKLKNGQYDFFHTWWYADREFVGSVKKYCSYSNNAGSLRRLRKEWGFTEQIAERMHELEMREIEIKKKIKVTPITRNSFLIGRFYPREDCLEKHSTDLPSLIAEDFSVLNPVLQEIYDKTLITNG